MARGESVSELKDQARRAEKREDWGRAVELYRRALRRSEEQGDLSLDLSLYNRIGDLHRRQGERERAVACYREAVEQYAEQGLHTGAVALCNKILRLDPDRAEVHRLLGRIHAESGLVAEARNAFRTYASEMETRGERDRVHDAYVELARLTGDVDLLLEVLDRMMEAGRREAARELLGEIAEERRARGDDLPEELRRRLRGLTPGGEASGAGGADDGDDQGEPGVGGDPAGEAAAPPIPAADPGQEQDGGRDDVGRSAEGASEDVPLEELMMPPEAPGEAADATGGADAEADDPPSPPPVPPSPEGAGEGGPETPPSPAEGPAVPGHGGEAEAGEPPEEDAGIDLGRRIRRRLGAGDDVRPGQGEGPPRGDFDDMLVGFRAEAAGTSGEADPAEHVELGLALRQMGLLDDAIREFQAAARASSPPVRALELMGRCFLEKGLHGVAVRVLNRALRLPGHQDHELLGVLYQLGVAHQEMEEHREALDCYERVFSVDIDFRDVARRMEEARSRA